MDKKAIFSKDGMNIEVSSDEQKEIASQHSGDAAALKQMYEAITSAAGLGASGGGGGGGGTQYLVDGAILYCTMGPEPKPLTVTPHDIELTGKMQGNKTDCVAGTNVKPFGAPCKITNKPCFPVIVGTWMSTNSKDTVGGTDSITMGSFLVCALGGLIQPITSGLGMVAPGEVDPVTGLPVKPNPATGAPIDIPLDKIKFNQLKMSLEEAADKQMALSKTQGRPTKDGFGDDAYIKPGDEDWKERLMLFMGTDGDMKNVEERYQHLVVSLGEKWRPGDRSDPNPYLTAEILNKYIEKRYGRLNDKQKAEFALRNMGEAFKKAEKDTGINAAFLLSTVISESAGLKKNPGEMYSFYGWNAPNTDSNQQYSKDNGGAGRNPSEAIINGAKKIKEAYVDNGQNTAFEMRWNYDDDGNPNHQYGTAINNSSARSNIMDEIFQMCDDAVYNEQRFEVPLYRNSEGSK